MTLFDLIVIVVLLASGFVGFIRGGAREIITVLAFILAVGVAVLGLRYSAPIAERLVEAGFLANALAILVVFSVVYALLRIAGAGLTRKIQGARALTKVDRVIGVGFGLLRGLLVLGVFFLVFHAATPPERVPGWIKDAALYPLSASSGHVLMALAPKGTAVASRVGPALKEAVGKGPADGGDAAASGTGAGYDAETRSSVDELVEKTR